MGKKSGLIFILWMLSFHNAWAWGPQGHRIAAHIAEMNLETRTWSIIQKEFSIKHLADVANWSDRIKKKRPEDRPFHYTNIESGFRTYLRSRDCPQGNCVTEKIVEFERILDGKESGKKERMEALKYLVHLVADVHQPMHVGNAGDRGGNEIAIRFRGERTNLHAFWDHDLIGNAGLRWWRVSRRWNAEISSKEAANWIQGNPIDWTNESRALVLDFGYSVVFAEKGEPSSQYVEQGQAIVREQLKRAGIRLAHLLNRIFR